MGESADNVNLVYVLIMLLFYSNVRLISETLT